MAAGGTHSNGIGPGEDALIFAASAYHGGLMPARDGSKRSAEWLRPRVEQQGLQRYVNTIRERIRLILANPGLKLEAWDQVAVEKERNDCARVTDSLWMEFMGLRHDSVNLVMSLKPADLDRAGMHPKVGELKVRWLLQEWISHDRNHTKQLLSIAMERVWPFMGNSQRFKGE